MSSTNTIFKALYIVVRRNTFADIAPTATAHDDPGNWNYYIAIASTETSFLVLNTTSGACAFELKEEFLSNQPSFVLQIGDPSESWQTSIERLFGMIATAPNNNQPHSTLASVMRFHVSHDENGRGYVQAVLYFLNRNGQALRDLETTLDDFAPAHPIFKDPPGMASPYIVQSKWRKSPPADLVFDGGQGLGAGPAGGAGGGLQFPSFPSSAFHPSS